MTDEELPKRAILLRNRFAVALGWKLAITPTGKAIGVWRAMQGDKPPRLGGVRVKWVKLPKPTGRGFVSLGPMQSQDASGAPGWVRAADAKAKPVVAVKRGKRAAALAKIAEQLPAKKLARVRKYAWQTADAEEASRHER